MGLITTWEVNLPGLGALLVEEGEGGDQDNTWASNLGVHVIGVIHEREESTWVKVWVKAVWGCWVQGTGGSHRAF